MKALIGIKKNMTQVFKDNGKVTPVTLIEVSNCFVCGLKSKVRDGYDATILGLGVKRRPLKPEIGKYKGMSVPRYVREVGVIDGVSIGDKILPSAFEVGSKVSVTSKTKGKGFAGVVKRWNFKGGPKTHGGESGKGRHPGSIGSRTTPGNVKKGKKMGGRMGGGMNTIVHLEVVDIKDNILVLQGSVPGATGTPVVVKGE